MSRLINKEEAFISRRKSQEAEKGINPKSDDVWEMVNDYNDHMQDIWDNFEETNYSKIERAEGWNWMKIGQLATLVIDVPELGVAGDIVYVGDIFYGEDAGRPRRYYEFHAPGDEGDGVLLTDDEGTPNENGQYRWTSKWPEWSRQEYEVWESGRSRAKQERGGPPPNSGKKPASGFGSGSGGFGAGGFGASGGFGAAGSGSGRFGGVNPRDSTPGRFGAASYGSGGFGAASYGSGGFGAAGSGSSGFSPPTPSYVWGDEIIINPVPPATNQVVISKDRNVLYSKNGSGDEVHLETYRMNPSIYRLPDQMNREIMSYINSAEYESNKQKAFDKYSVIGARQTAERKKMNPPHGVWMGGPIGGGSKKSSKKYSKTRRRSKKSRKRSRKNKK